MKVKSVITVGIGLASVFSNYNHENAVEKDLINNCDIINGSYFPSKKWVDFYDVCAFTFINGKHRLIYIVGNEIPAYVEIDNGYKLFKKENGYYVNVKLEKEDIEQLESFFRIMVGIHNI